MGQVLLLLFVVAYVLSAWTSDDAYISFRTIDNALAGLNPGLRCAVIAPANLAFDQACVGLCARGIGVGPAWRS